MTKMAPTQLMQGVKNKVICSDFLLGFHLISRDRLLSFSGNLASLLVPYMNLSFLLASESGVGHHNGRSVYRQT